MTGEVTLIEDSRLREVIVRQGADIPWRRRHWQRRLKRAFDVVVAAVLLVALSPVIVLTALLVRITSKGPVLLSQTRIGLNGVPLRMLKFRSMRAETADGFVSKRGEVTGVDPRLTPIGRWIRAWRLDELPQLFHVLTGTMSLVGPRPDIPANLGLYTPEQALRFTMPPGCTAWTFTRGVFANDWHERQNINVEYVRQWSFWLDVKILIGSVFVLLAQKNTTPESSALLHPREELAGKGNEL